MPSQAYCYTPANPHAYEKLPIHIYWYASAFIILLLTSDSKFCFRLAKKLNMIVIDADYRKAPAHPFPLINNGAEDVVSWVLGQPSRFDLSKISLAGHSAGENLALFTARVFNPKISSTVCAYPKVDFVGPYKKPPVSVMRSGFELTPWLVNLMDKAYFLKSDDRVNPKASPTLMDLKTFPTTTVFISVGDADLLYNESKEFIEKLNKDGHPDAVMLTMEGEGHAFDKEATNEITQKNVKEFDEAMMEAIKRGWKNQVGSA